MVINFVNAELFPIFFEADRILKSHVSKQIEFSKLEDRAKTAHDLAPSLSKYQRPVI